MIVKVFSLKDRCVPHKPKTHILTIPSVGKGAEKLDLSYFAGGYVKCYSCMENSLAACTK